MPFVNDDDYANVLAGFGIFAFFGLFVGRQYLQSVNCDMRQQIPQLMMEIVRTIASNSTVSNKPNCKNMKKRAEIF